MPLSKSKRFAIFARDGFTCQYCGLYPPEVILEVDHIEPKSKGGTDEDINLITSCADCNRGKSAKRLGEFHPKPDADMMLLKSQQEIAEAKRYLKQSKAKNKLIAKVKAALLSTWLECISTDYVPSDKQWKAWMGMYSADEIEYGLRQTGPSVFRGKFGNPRNQGAINQSIRYASAIMRNKRQENQAVIQ